MALIIAEYQSDLHYRDQKLALADFLPLDTENWITSGNALEIDWLSVCPSTGKSVKIIGDDLFTTPVDQAEVEFENEGGETYICGNPPYLGSTWQSKEQKADLERIFKNKTKNWKSLDYVSGWFMKAAEYGTHTNASSAFVSTNSICQGQQVPILWPLVFNTGHEINFAHTSLKWANLASHNAGVTVVIVGISNQKSTSRRLYSASNDGSSLVNIVENINAYLVPGVDLVVNKFSRPVSTLSAMTFGSKPVDGGNLLLSKDELEEMNLSDEDETRFIRPIYGSEEFINGKARFCIWVKDEEAQIALDHPLIGPRIQKVREMRLNSPKAATVKGAEYPHKFDERRQIGDELVIAVAAISSENRDYLPCGPLPRGTIISNKCYALFNAPLWNMSIIASRLHWVWIGTVCVRMRTDFSYSNTLGWNTFPLRKLTEKNKEDLTQCAENILLAREAHFPATIADLYDPENMPEDLRRAHERNDEVLERIYIGRRFKNDTERLEKLFDLYTQMTFDSSSEKAKKVN